MQNTLNPITGERENKAVYYATTDIEAHHWVNFQVIGFYDGQNNVYKDFECFEEYATFIFDHCGLNSIDNIFAHAGGKYDFNFLLRHFCFDSRYIVADIIPRGSGLLSFSIEEVEPTHYDCKGRPFKITFRDSLALLPFALRKIAKFFKVKTQKGDIDYTTLEHSFTNVSYEKYLIDRPKEYIVKHNNKIIKKLPKNYDVTKITYTVIADESEHKKIYNKNDVLFYLKDDCVALWEVLNTFYHWPLVQKSGLCFTTASQAVKVWQTFLHGKVFSLSKSVDKFVREGYFGGRTEVFRTVFDATYDLKENRFGFGKKGLALIKEQIAQKQLNYYDINSLYPTVMQCNDFPIKLESYAFGENYDPKSLGFWRCDVIVPEGMHVPPLGIKHTFADGTEKLIFPTGNFSGIWTTYELEYAKTLGVEVKKIHMGYTFVNGGKIFKTYIDTMYDMRLKAKRAKDPVNNLLTKLMMNSTYGRLGLNTDRENLVIDEGQEGVSFHSEITNDEGETIRFMRNPVSLDTSFTNVAISAYVTSYARVMLHQDLVKLGQDLYYCDTDSMFTSKVMETGDELGQWKLEYATKDSCFLLPKTYINDGVMGEEFEKKVTMKGFDYKKIKDYTFDDFVKILTGELKELRVIQEPKFATLKTALQKGHFVCMNYDPVFNRQLDIKKEKEYYEKTGRKKKIVKDKYEPSTRALKAKYDKRILINEGFMTKPIHLS